MTLDARWALLFFLPWTAAAWRMLRRSKPRALPFAPLARVPVRHTLRQRLATLAPLLLLAGLAAAIVAAARPYQRLGQSVRTAEAVAIAMVVDVSGSMEALDFSTRRGDEWEFRNRLDVVKETFRTFIQRRPDDLIGLISFGGYAVTRSPLTFDHNALLHVLDGVEIPHDEAVHDPQALQTAIGDALALACARLEHETNITSRIAVLLSDGESNAGILSTAEATRIAQSLGIRVYTIGVGTTGMAPFRARDVFGREVLQQVPVSMDEEDLRRIAAETGGLYFAADDLEGLNRAMEAIDALERSPVEQAQFERRRERHEPWLWSAFALLALATTIHIAATQRAA